MRELRLVSGIEDGTRLLVETPDSGEQFSLPVDAALRSALQSTPEPATAARQDEPAGDAAEPPIGPREIQVRVRSGESPEELAETYGMALDRVMRFAAPVLDERRRISEEARRARARRTGSDDATHVIFGEAVDERFQAHGIGPDTVRWDARRREDGEWLVIAEWVGGEWLGGEATHTAQWAFSRSSRSVTPLDDTAADLLSDRPIRPVMPPPPPDLSAAPPLVPGVVAFPPMPDAVTGPVPVVDDSTLAPRFGRPFSRRLKQNAPEPEAAPAATPPPAAPRPPVPAASAAQAPTEPGLPFDEPPLPLGIADPAPRPSPRRHESDEERAARARIPSWDDILLGIKRRD